MNKKEKENMMFLNDLEMMQNFDYEDDISSNPDNLGITRKYNFNTARYDKAIETLNIQQKEAVDGILEYIFENKKNLKY